MLNTNFISPFNKNDPIHKLSGTVYSTNQIQKLKHTRFDDGLPLIKVKQINGRRWA